MSGTSPTFIEQRRYLRLNASDIGHLTCSIEVGPGERVTLESSDISPGGFGAVIPEALRTRFAKGGEYAHCRINLPGMTDLSVRLVDFWQLQRHDGEARTIAGFEFTGPLDWLSTGLESCVMPD